jgi:hypothetical protein
MEFCEHGAIMAATVWNRPSGTVAATSRTGSNLSPMENHSNKQRA